MRIETRRLIITEFKPDMAQDVHLNSLDEDNRRFVPDEVFETIDEARETVAFLINCYDTGEGPLVYPVLLKDGTNIGYVQAVPMDNGAWEIGYHIAKAFTGNGYACEAVQSFLPVIMEKLNITSVVGICVHENHASRRVMERTGFEKIYEGTGDYQGSRRMICRYEYHNMNMAGSDL